MTTIRIAKYHKDDPRWSSDDARCRIVSLPQEGEIITSREAIMIAVDLINNAELDSQMITEMVFSREKD